ncbi:MAG: HAD family hydrolase [Pseudomonadota bacterium]
MRRLTRIAMWSGPRNLSTAMMRSFSSRPDCQCIDEPFYAAWLKETGANHPMRAEILHHHETDPEAVSRTLAAGMPGDRPLHYEKHMTHHGGAALLDHNFHGVRHAFLIRHPARVLASYAAKMTDVSLAAIGFTQQSALFDRLRKETGKTPVVIDADAILRDPVRMLSALCAALDIPYLPAMLTWPAGPHPADGVWARHWYASIHASTGFGAPPGPLPAIAPAHETIAAEAQGIYDRLGVYCLR